MTHRVAYANSEGKAPDWDTLRLGDPHLIVFTEGAETGALDGYRRIGDADAVVYVREGCEVTHVARLRMDEPWEWHKHRGPRVYLAVTVDGIDYLAVHFPPISHDHPNTEARAESRRRCAEYMTTGPRRFGPCVLLGDLNIRGTNVTRFGLTFQATAQASLGAVDHALGRGVAIVPERYDGKAGRPEYDGAGHGPGAYEVTTT